MKSAQVRKQKETPNISRRRHDIKAKRLRIKIIQKGIHVIKESPLHFWCTFDKFKGLA